MEQWVYPQPQLLKSEHPLFLCVLSNTDTANIPGISAAGKPGLIDYTPAGDAELVTLGRTICNSEPPTTGMSPTPAVITRAAIQLTKIPFMFINSGLKVLPRIPLLDVGGKPGNDIRIAHAVPDARLIYENSVELGCQISRLSDFVIIGESVPGGTTTAMCILRALGMDGKVSSSHSSNPLPVKVQTVEAAFGRAGLSYGDLADDPMQAIENFGDPMMPCICGLMDGLESTCIMLAGGTQMMAVLALVKQLGIKRNVSIATTKFVADDPSASFLKTVAGMGINSYVADPGFARSNNIGLKLYESGVVKEGVGAGGAMFAAALWGIGQEEFRARVELVCKQAFAGTSPVP